MEGSKSSYIGQSVVYYDQVGKAHVALITNDWGQDLDNSKPSINLVYVSDDVDRTDPYGRQLVRETSVVHRDNQYAHGRYWERV